MADKVLLVCSSSPAKVRRAISAFRTTLPFKITTWICCARPETCQNSKNGREVRQHLVFPKRHELYCRSPSLGQSRSGTVCGGCRTLVPGAWQDTGQGFCPALPGRRILVFNENADCAFLSLPFLWSFT